MTLAQIFQAGIALVAAGTPWLVVAILRSQARGHAGTGDRTAVEAAQRAARRLAVATAGLAVPLTGLALLVTPPSGRLALAMVAAFATLATFGMAAIGALDAATKSDRELIMPSRVASLRPRELDAYVPRGSRLLAYGITAFGVAGIVYQSLLPVVGRRLFVPIGFAIAAAVFLLLYEAWMREEVSGGQAEGGHALSSGLTARRYQVAAR